MKNILLTSSLFLLANYFLPAQNGSWLQKANFGGISRSNAVGFSIGSYGYMGTGNTGTAAKDFWRYDPSNNSWTQMADFGGGLRWGATGFAIGNFGYIGTGINGSTYYKDFWRYDPSGNSWAARANFGGAARYYAFGFASGASGYIGTGADGSQAYNDVWRYNPVADTWTARANFNNARMDAFAFYVNGKGYAGTGRTFGGSPTFYNDFYMYDSTSNTWTAKAAFGGTAREGVGAFVIGNNGYAGTGSINNYATDYTDFYKYNPVANTWTAVATFPGSQRTNAATFAVGNFGYLGTGFSVSSTTFNFFQYDICGITTTVTATATSCNGGSNGSISLSTANATNPLTYLWSNSSSSQNPSGLTAGNYTVTITDGAGCTKTATTTVSQPTVLTGSISSLTNASCNSLCNGKLTAAGSGATAPYTYVWSNGTSAATTTGLCAGNYSVTITDSKGCTATGTTTITQPIALTATLTSTNSTKACVCNGTATVSISGGTPTYTYQWCNGSFTSVATGLCGGTTCTLTVVDGNGCPKFDTATVGGPTALTLSMTATPATCPSCPDGSASATTGGGTSPYTYSWTTTPVQTTQTATGLTPAYYHVCVTDADTCMICDSVYVGFSVGVQENSSNNILISPNPSLDGEFSIYNLQNKNYDIELFDMVGQKILSERITNRNTCSLRVNSKEGIYFLKLISGNAVITRKIILSR